MAERKPQDEPVRIEHADKAVKSEPMPELHTTKPETLGAPSAVHEASAPPDDIEE